MFSEAVCTEKPIVPPFEVFEIDRADRVVCVAIREDLIWGVANALAEVPEGTPRAKALWTLATVLKISKDVLDKKRDIKTCPDLKETELVEE